MPVTVLGTLATASASGTAVLTLTTASTPGKHLTLLWVTQGAVVSTITDDGGPAGAGWLSNERIIGPSVWIGELVPSSHDASISALTFNLTTDGEIIAVLLEHDERINLYADGTTGVGGTNYTTTGWEVGSHTAAGSQGLALFYADRSDATPVTDFAVSFDQGFTEIADTGSSTGAQYMRMWLAEGADVNLSAGTVTMTTTDSSEVNLVAGLLVTWDAASSQPDDVLNRQVWEIGGAAGEASTSKSLTLAFTPTAGSLLVVAAQAAATFSTPTGWTRQDDLLDAYAAVIFTKTADGTETSIDWTQNGPRAAVAYVWELPAGSAIDSHPSGVGWQDASFPSWNIGTIGTYPARRVWIQAFSPHRAALASGDQHHSPIYAAGGSFESAELAAADITVPTGETRDFDWYAVEGAGLKFVRILFSVPEPATAPDSIPVENAKPGSTASISTLPLNGAVGFLGYVKQFSTDAGGTVEFAVDGVGAVEIDVYRYGHYAGDLKRLVATLTNTPTAQAAGSVVPDSNGATTMAWTTTASWAVPATMTSGFFLAVVKDSGGAAQAWIPFVVRNDSVDADIVVKMSDSTWAMAYNYFGNTGGTEKTGASVYGSGGALGDANLRAHYVSADRPVVTHGSVVNHWDALELPLIDWLEGNGYSVKYIGCYDLDQQDTVDVLGNAKVLISVGHDEYWSQGMRDNAEAFRDAGGHLIFMAGNHVFWRIRWDNGGRGFWCYKDTLPGPGGHVAGAPLDPVSWTGTWKDTRRPFPPGPEHEYTTTGDTFRMNGLNDLTATIQAATYGPSPFWRDTTVQDGPTDLVVPLVVGFEANQHMPPDSGAVRLAATVLNIDGYAAGPNGENTSGDGDLDWGPVMFLAGPASGVTVGFGTCQWQWGLSDAHDRGSAVANVQMRQATANLLADLGVSAGTLQVDLTDPTPVALSTYGLTYTGVDPQITADPGSLWQPGIREGSASDTSGTNPVYNLALRFSVSAAGEITHLHYYKESAADLGNVTVALVDLTAGQVLATETLAAGTNTGWLTVALSTPVQVAADGTTYGAVVVIPAGQPYTYLAGAGGAVNGDLTGLSGGAFAESATVVASGFTTFTNWYGMDVTYQAGAAIAPALGAGVVDALAVGATPAPRAYLGTDLIYGTGP